MNIQEAKNCVMDAVSAYLEKDAGGSYIIPRNRQRPLVVMGPPGLGKTAIMRQIADELCIGYVGYAMTHHTRQSAIGLPVIEKAVYGGRSTDITRYTMSEIIASVYDEIEEGGRAEGILFIDEINCVSETLSAAMLDLLQNKKLGPHPIPDGWILVAAGNPPEYNSSAREFDMATLDRIRLMDVEADTDVWLRYARSSGVHPAVTYYIQMKPGNLLSVESTPSGPEFVTPRAWEDLSMMLNRYDSLGLSFDLNVITQYIRSPPIAAEFKRYLDFHRKYSSENDVESILNGTATDLKLKNADVDERLSIISVLIGSINSDADHGSDADAALSDAELLSSGAEEPEGLIGRLRKSTDRTSRYRLGILNNLGDAIGGSDSHIAMCKDEAERSRGLFEDHLGNAASYIRGCFGDGQETVAFLSGLLGCRSVVMYSLPDGVLYGLNDDLFVSGRDRRIESLLEGVE